MHADELRSSYDAVAETYAQTFFDELARKPFDRDLLDAFAAAEVGATAVEIGCGPGQVGRYLSERGMDVTGVDLSPAMIEVARRLNPRMRFEVADMRSLGMEDGAVDAIVAFYSLIHIPLDEVPGVLEEFRRVLRPSGRLLLAVHGGSGTVTSSVFLGHRVPFEATRFEKDQLVELVTQAGFEVKAATVRSPYDFELATPRLYVEAVRKLAKPTPRPAAPGSRLPPRARTRALAPRGSRVRRSDTA
jgi:SAM-dependent methyltransferase